LSIVADQPSPSPKTRVPVRKRISAEARGPSPRTPRDLPRPDAAPQDPAAYSATCLALRNVRGVFILILVSVHGSLAYLGSTVAPAASFDRPPFEWLAFPIVDSRRWYGFDIYCAWEDVHVMALMFFLSGLFVAPSLTRKGSWGFLRDRARRLVTPFLFSTLVLMPIAIYPVYRTLAPDPSLAAYARAYAALPFLPNGPTWFLWVLLALSAVVAIVYRLRPGALSALGRLASGAKARPGRYVLGLTLAGACAYVPLALAFDPWDWLVHGPLSVQESRPLLYAVYFCAGIGVSAHGLERGLLAPDGVLARRWRALAVGAPLAFALWMALAAVTLFYPAFAPLPMRFVSAASYALACACGVCFMLAASMRFGLVRSRPFDLLSENALGIYVLHYAPLVWTQYALLNAPLPAILKALIVFSVTLSVTLCAVIAMRRHPLGARLIGETPLT
jgi:fucose 4-O-acetylase-like acetyltransferase